MFFIGIITDKNSENNIKNVMKDTINRKNEIIFLNKENINNFRNVQFDSVVVNEKMDDNALDKILEKSKYILLNSDIHYRSDNLKNDYSKIITYGYNSKATVTISSATEENYMIFIQDNIVGRNEIKGIQEIRFDKFRNNINAYDGMIITIMKLIYDKPN